MGATALLLAFALPQLLGLLAGALVDVASARVAFLVGGVGALATAIPAALVTARRRG